MGLTSTLSQDGGTLAIRLGKRFDFSDHDAFREAYRQHDVTKISIIINFGQTEYLDSAALGMLLVLRERAGGDDANIVLESCRSPVQQIMDITRFERLFTIRA